MSIARMEKPPPAQRGDLSGSTGGTSDGSGENRHR
jgi:hypothetical protein